MTTQQRDLIINELYHILHELCEDVTEMRASLKNMRASVKEIAKELEVIAEHLAILQQAARTRQMGGRLSEAQGAAEPGEEVSNIGADSDGGLTTVEAASSTAHAFSTKHSRKNLRDCDLDFGVGGWFSELAPAHPASRGLLISAQTTSAPTIAAGGKRARTATIQELDETSCSDLDKLARVSEGDVPGGDKPTAVSGVRL
ncbi:hypothetical protein LTR53_007277 [Teratosphaeriaceae sp. CCFEE 6253]|nr:hypothetical protein LTR53_007277 [Teratosphaeriaceae sp. CCFEE 6253]